jgi:hypothetical protein
MWNNLERVLEQMANDTVAAIKSEIQYQDLIRTGTLLGSIDWRWIRGNEMEPEVEFIMVDYGKYLDEGTRYITAREFFKKTIRMGMQKWDSQIKLAATQDLTKFITE